MLMVLVSVMIGSSFSAPQFLGRPGGLIGLRRPGGFGGRPVFGNQGFGNQGFGNQGFGNQGFAPG